MSTRGTEIEAWLESLAAKTPTPGGGAAAALSAAIAAALVGMVTNYTTGGKWADRESRMVELNAEAAQLRAHALRLADEDESAFAAVGAAYAMAKQTPAEADARRAAIQAALAGAAGPPTQTGRLAARLVEIATELAGSGNPNVISDVAVASSAARCAIEAAVVNVEVNRRLIADDDERARLDGVVAELAAALERADQATAAVRSRLT